MKHILPLIYIIMNYRMQQFAFQKGMESDTGYECQTTFFDDLTIAEMC